MEFLVSRNAKLIVVILEAIILAGLFFGYYLIHYKQNRAAHEKNQTSWVLFNLVPILFVMAVNFSNMARASFTPPLIVGHVILGTVCELSGIYLVLRMKNKLPQNWRVKNFKRMMQITLSLWTLQALGGFFIYYSFYIKG
jgi:uncharacterized membrane protein YozB (DUF420 family)